MGVEVQGRWSHETKLLVGQLARAKAWQEPWLLRRRAEQAWRMRWGSLIACAVARAVALSLPELPRAIGADGDTPAAYDVERDFIHVGWRCEPYCPRRVPRTLIPWSAVGMSDPLHTTACGC